MLEFAATTRLTSISADYKLSDAVTLRGGLAYGPRPRTSTATCAPDQT